MHAWLFTSLLLLCCGSMVTDHASMVTDHATVPALRCAQCTYSVHGDSRRGIQLPSPLGLCMVLACVHGTRMCAWYSHVCMANETKLPLWWCSYGPCYSTRPLIACFLYCAGITLGVYNFHCIGLCARSIKHTSERTVSGPSCICGSVAKHRACVSLIFPDRHAAFPCFCSPFWGGFLPSYMYG